MKIVLTLDKKKFIARQAIWMLSAPKWFCWTPNWKAFLNRFKEAVEEK